MPGLSKITQCNTWYCTTGWPQKPLTIAKHYLANGMSAIYATLESCGNAPQSIKWFIPQKCHNYFSEFIFAKWFTGYHTKLYLLTSLRELNNCEIACRILKLYLLHLRKLYYLSGELAQWLSVGFEIGRSCMRIPAILGPLRTTMLRY